MIGWHPNCSNPSEWRRGTAWVALPRSVSTAHPLGQWSAVAQQWSQFCLMGTEIKENQEKQTLFSRIKPVIKPMVLFGCVEIWNPIPHQTLRGWHYRTMLSIETVWQRHKRHKLSWKPTTRSESLKFFPVAGFFIPRVVAGIQKPCSRDYSCHAETRKSSAKRTWVVHLNYLHDILNAC